MPANIPRPAFSADKFAPPLDIQFCEPDDAPKMEALLGELATGICELTVIHPERGGLSFAFTRRDGDEPVNPHDVFTHAQVAHGIGGLAEAHHYPTHQSYVESLAGTAAEPAKAKGGRKPRGSR